MIEPPELSIVREFQKCGRLFARGVIDSSEFCGKAFSLFEYHDHVCVHANPQLWEVLPVAIRAEFVEVIRGALAPDFRCLPRHLLPDPEPRTARVRAWAQGFAHFWDEAEPIP